MLDKDTNTLELDVLKINLNYLNLVKRVKLKRKKKVVLNLFMVKKQNVLLKLFLQRKNVRHFK